MTDMTATGDSPTEAPGRPTFTPDSDRDERIKIDMDPEDALRVMLRPVRKPER